MQESNTRISNSVPGILFYLHTVHLDFLKKKSIL